MAIVAFTPTFAVPHDELHPFERLAVRLSSSFSTLQSDETDEAIANALEEIAANFGVEECTLIRFSDNESANVVRSWATHPYSPCSDDDLGEMPWLVSRISRNAVVTLTPTSAAPHAADQDRAYLERSGLRTRLAVPVVVGTHVLYGLMLGSRQRHMDWRQPVIERLRLVGEIVGSGLARLRSAGAAVLRHGAADRDVDDRYREGTSSSLGEQRIIGTSAAINLAMTRMAQVAPLDATVLLLGETGTGKELLANAVHDRSRRRQRRLVCVNCAALPPTLIESELFGHERGAFTGAAGMRQGRFEIADGGTIFLDEIGDLAPELQTKLLRVLQHGEFERVGSSKTRRVDVRVIAATNIDLETAVAESRFRADLYYRLSVFPITLPPLRERLEDIPELVWFFVRRQQHSLGRRIDKVPRDVMQTLQQHDWPGNVRELENVIARGMIRSTNGTLELDELPRLNGKRTVAMAPPVAESGETLDAVQRRHIERVLRECGGRINGVGNAATRLGLHPNTLRFRIKKLGVVIPQRRANGAVPPGGVRS